MKTYIITEQDVLESAAVWASIEAEKATRPAVTIRIEAPPVREGRGGSAAARAQGWAVDPALSMGNQHAPGACQCRGRLCQCACHGKTFVHYRRGA